MDKRLKHFELCLSSGLLEWTLQFKPKPPQFLHPKTLTKTNKQTKKTVVTANPYYVPKISVAGKFKWSKENFIQ